MDRWGVAGLPDLRVQPEIGDELVGRLEPREVAHRGDDRDRDDDVNPWDRHQSSYGLIPECLLRDGPIRMRELAAQEVQLPQQRRHRRAFVLGERERLQPCPAGLPEQIRHRRARHQVAMQHCLHAVLDFGALLHQMRPRGGHPPQHRGAIVGQPDRRQEVHGKQLREDPRVDLVGLDLRLSDRPRLQRVRHHDAARVLRQQARNRIAVAGRFQRDLVIDGELRSPRSKRLGPAIHPSRIDNLVSFDDRDLREIAMHVHTDESRHHRAPSTRSQRRERAEQPTLTDSRSRRSRTSRKGGHLLTRALSPSCRTACPYRFPKDAPVPDGLTVEPSPGARPARRTREAPPTFISGTNAIESLNARYRRAVRARGHFPNDAAALKCLYLVTRSLDPTGRGRARWVTRWKPALNAFAITFEGRIN